MNRVNYGIQGFNYFASNFIELLEDTQANNIGVNGENLTICILSLNRVELTMKLINSVLTNIPLYKGNILIYDNGSNEKQLIELKEFCSSLSLKISIVESDKNYGVAGGRNRAIQHVETDWVFFLDNDIYFINNPLDRIKEEISVMGCHFINVPLLDPDQPRFFAYGGNLFIDSFDGKVTLGGGSCYKQMNPDELDESDKKPFLSTFLFGGASILKKDSFVKLGGFDENMFIGFEDVDFSVRLFREGYKIGNTSAISLIHDHPKPKENEDIDYEKKRYSADIIRNSALYLEKKYGFSIWDENLVKWIEEKNNFIGNELKLETKESTDTTNKKPKIALITDVDYWAFGNISKQIEKHLSQFYEIQIISYEQCDWNLNKVLLSAHECDLLHFFWREMIPVINEDNYKAYFGDIPLKAGEFFEQFYENKVLSTSVYDHLYLNDNEIKEREVIFNKFNYYVSSEKLKTIYDNISSYKNPKMVIEDGVDPNMFYPSNLERFDDVDRPLVIGWVGNSKWSSEIEDFKGFNTILKPVIEELELTTSGLVKGHYSDRNNGLTPHNQMVNYYSEIDVLVCVSKIEGTPNPVLEAMACGVPVISTDVGIVPQVFGSKQSEFVLEERTAVSLKQNIMKILNNRSYLKELSQENLVTIQEWHWDKQCSKFKAYFDELLNL